MILNIGGGGGLPIRLIVTAPTGSAVSVTQGTTVLAANEVDGVWTFAIPSLGVWTIHATIDGQSLTQDVDISKVGQYNVTLEKPVSNTLNDNDWATIKEVADASEGANYWAVGDTKQITMNGKLSDGLTLSNYQTWVYIIGFDHNSSVEGTGIAFGGFKTAASGGIDVALCDSGYSTNKTSGQWFNMNNSVTNTGGWASCRMRSTTLPLVKSALPPDLQAVIKTTSIYSDNHGGGRDTASYVTATQDELYLLAEFEIFGARTRANSAEQNHQQQYAYYVAGNSKIKYRHDSTATAVLWWERSVIATNAGNFCSVDTNGVASNLSARISYGLAVAFKVGGVKYTPVEYISSTGTQYIDTGIVASSGFEVEIKLKANSYNNLCSIIGAHNDSSPYGRNYLGITSSHTEIGQCDSVHTYTAIDTDSSHVVLCSNVYNNMYFIVDNVAQSTSGAQSGGTYSKNTLYLFWCHGGAQWFSRFSGRIYYCKITESGTLVRDFIPAKDEVGNVGLYDKVEGKFYYNAGTGSFGISEVSLDKT